MKLDDFLKCKKVRLLTDGHTNLNKGSEYNLVRLEVVISNNSGIEGRYPLDDFEPVLDAAENPLQDMELTPEFEAVEPTFKVGDKVYWGLKSRIFKVCRLMTANVLQVELDDFVVDVHKDELCPATVENYGKLCSLFERIDFEQPPKELKGSDLCRAMLNKGWKYVPCYVHDRSDDEAMNRKHYVSVKKETPKGGYNFSGTGANDWKYAVPIDPRTGNPLTESILND